MTLQPLDTSRQQREWRPLPPGKGAGPWLGLGTELTPLGTTGHAQTAGWAEGQQLLLRPVEADCGVWAGGSCSRTPGVAGAGAEEGSGSDHAELGPH